MMKYFVFVFLVFFAGCLGLAQNDAKLVLSVGHFERITDVSFTPNGKYILTASLDNTAIIWDAYQGKVLSVLRGHSGHVNSINASPDSKMVATKSNDNTVKVWRIPDGKLVYDISCDKCFSGAIAFSLDSKLLAFATGEGEVFVLDLNSGSIVKEIKCCEKWVTQIVFSSDSKSIFVSGYDEKLIKKISLLTGEVIFSFVYDDEWSPVLEMNNDGTVLVLTGKNCSYYDARTGMFMNKTINHDNSGGTKIYSPDSSLFVYDLSVGIMTVDVYNAKTDEIIFTSKYGGSQVTDIKINSDRNVLYSVNDDKTIRKWDIHNGKLLTTILGNRTGFYGYASMEILDENTLITAYYREECAADIWNINSKDKIAIIPDLDVGYSEIPYITCKFNSDSSLILISNIGCISIIDIETYQIVFQYSEPYIRTAEWANHDKNLIINFQYSGREPIIWNTETWTIVYSFDNTMYENTFILEAEMSKNGELVFTYSVQGDIGIWDAETFTLIYSSKENKGNDFVDYIEKFDYIITKDSIGFINIHSLADGTLYASFKSENDAIDYVEINDDATKFLTYSNASRSLIIWDLISQKVDERMTVDKLPPCYFCDNADFFEIENYNIICYDKKSLLEKYRLVVVNDSDYICLLPDNYYSCSFGASLSINWFLNNKYFGFEQFDLKYNRPDIVLERLGYASPELIEAYHQAYLKRIKRMGFTEEQLSGEFHVPETAIENFEYMPVIDESEIEIKLNFNDSKYNLDRYNIWINDVPVYGMYGKTLRGKDTDNFSVTETIVLCEGENKIQVSCLNEKGAESLKETEYITYKPKVSTKSNLYLIAISVSDYQDSTMNLKYAVKDGRDMANLFAQNTGNRYENVYIDTLFDSNATVENVAAAKTKLMSSKVDDEVILYVSGHGLLDDNLDFYFASHNMDFSDPSKYGISYDLLEGLLDSIPARKKIFLMDACHSGEVDKENTAVSDSLLAIEGGKNGLKTYTYRGGDMTEEEGLGLGLQNSFELMQELFANLNRGSGAVVISAAAGNSYALESKEWNNGVFTYAILNGLINKEADQNKDGQIMVSELRAYVINEVEQLTHGRQKPTCRQENLEFDWRVW